jgi:orotidine-5'-phosphate decarboxylase
MMTKFIENSNIANPIICAIDTIDVATAKSLVGSVAPHIGAVKLGLEFFTANGASGVAQVAGDLPLFLDLKFHDIPNTVAGAIRATAGINSFMMTVHTAGGKAMMQAASAAAKTLPNKPLIVGVTVLTSLDSVDLENIGVNAKLQDQVKRLASLAQESGLDGVVCSAHEIEIIRETCGKDFKLVVPGIRPAGSSIGDQKRVMTPSEAIAKGADYLVIGRPITEAQNPSQAAQEIFASI